MKYTKVGYRIISVLISNQIQFIYNIKFVHGNEAWNSMTIIQSKYEKYFKNVENVSQNTMLMFRWPFTI